MRRLHVYYFGMTEIQKPTVYRVSTLAIEAANRAEATALLIRCGYRVYRPEVDFEGEDLVVLTPKGELHGVQLKGGAAVDIRVIARAIRHASSLLSRLVTICRCGSSSK